MFCNVPETHLIEESGNVTQCRWVSVPDFSNEHVASLIRVKLSANNVYSSWTF